MFNMISDQSISAGQDVLDAAMGCINALSKVSVGEEVRNQLIGKIFQSLGDIHNNEAHKRQRRMNKSKESWNNEKAQGEIGNQTMKSQKFQNKRSLEEVRISSLFASLSEAVSQGALDIKDFFLVVALLEESVLKTDGNSEHSKKGMLAVLQNNTYGKGMKGNPVENDKEEVSLEQASSLVLWKARQNEDVHLHGDDEHETNSRNYEISKCSEERERPLGPLDNRQAVTHVVAPQGTLVHGNSSYPAVPDLQSPQYDYPSCTAAGKANVSSNTHPRAAIPTTIIDMPISNSFATSSEIFEKDVIKKGTHVTSALPPQQNDENCPPLKNNLGNSVSKALSFLEAAKRSVNTPSDEDYHHNQTNGGKSNHTSRFSCNNSQIFKIDQDVLNKRMEMCRFSILGKLTLAKGEEPWTWSKLKSKLDSSWNLNSHWKLISIGKGFFHIVLSNREEYESVWSKGIIHLNPGILRLQCWKFGFDPTVEKTTKALVWFRIFQLPWCLWDASVIWGIANKIGQPLRIDKQTLEGNFGHYARVLIEVDLAESIMPSVLVDCNGQILEVKISPESLPNFCTGCKTIGHSVNECRRFSRMETAPISAQTDRSQLPVGSKREHRDIGMDTTIGTSTFKRNAQQPKWRKKEAHNLDNGKVHSARKNIISKAIVETVTDFSTQGGSLSPISKRTDALVISNQFSALEREVDDADMVVEISSMNNGKDGKSDEEEESPAHFTEEDIDLPKIPSRWSDLVDEDVNAVVSSPIQENSKSSNEASSNFERTFGDTSGFRKKLHDDCIWLNHDDDAKYDRDMCVEMERYKNSAKETRNFIATLPKRDKKVKMAFRQPQGKASFPKQQN